MTPRLKELFVKKIQPNLKEKLGYRNLYMVPQIQKVVLNMGLGADGNDTKIINRARRKNTYKIDITIDQELEKLTDDIILN